MWLGISDAIEHWARYSPNKIALHVGDKDYDYKSLMARANSIRYQFARIKLQGRVGILEKDKFEFLAFLVGLKLARYSVVVLNPNSSKEAMKVNLNDTSPSALVGSLDLIEEFRDIIPPDVEIINSLDVLADESARFSPEVEKEEWGVLFSSGSTGVSKAIVYNHLSMTSELLAWCLELGIRRETKFYVGRPIQYTGGLVLTLATLLVGGYVSIPALKDDDNFSTVWEHYQKCLEAGTLDFAFFVPDQLRTFMKIAKDPLSASTILTMGAPISGEEKKSVFRLLNSNVIESWGNSEGLGTITDKEDLSIRPNSIGRPFLTEKIFVVTDNLNECKVFEKGRLAGSQETMFLEYANRPEATNMVKKNNLVLSDDLGYMDENHFFYILGRDQESFVIEGETVHLSDQEEKVRKLTGDCEISLVAIEESGTPSFYLLIAHNGEKSKRPMEEAIKKALKVKLSAIIYVDKLPRLTSGKIDRITAAKILKESNEL